MSFNLNATHKSQSIARRLSVLFDCRPLSISRELPTLPVSPYNDTCLQQVPIALNTDRLLAIVDFFAVGIWSASESTLGIMIASLPAAYQMFKRRVHHPSPLPPSSAETVANTSAEGCCGGHHHHHHPIPTPTSRLRRRHSISIDISTVPGKAYDDSMISPRSFGPAPSIDDGDTIELASPIRSQFPGSGSEAHHQCSCGRPWPRQGQPRPGEYLGLSERFMASQDVSVTIRNPSGEGTTTMSPEKARYYI